MRDRLHKEIEALLLDGMLDSDLGDLLVNMIDFELDRFLSELRKMIDGWEAAELDREHSYYSLALRRVYDMIDGRSAFDQLPILETEDTSDGDN